MKDLGKPQSSVSDSNEIECGGVGDDERKFTEHVMDRHLSQLESNSIDKSGNTVADIAQYMAKLKANHMESETNHSKVTGKMRNGSIVRSAEIDEESASDGNTTGAGATATTTQSSEDERPPVVIDKRVDKIFKSIKTGEPKLLDVKPQHRGIQQSKSPDRSSPIKIVKVRSPRNSLDADTVILTRRHSRERSISPKVRSKSSEASTSKLGDDVAPGGGILKRNTSPGIRKSRPSPDRQCSPSISRQSLSPHTSFDSRSPDRSHYSMHSRSFDACTSNDRRPNESYYADLSFTPSPNKARQMYSNQSSIESRSPSRDRKRSLSAHSTFYQIGSPEPNAQQYHQHYPSYAPTRMSKSLERSSSKDSYGSYRRGYSPERIYHINQPVRSQSAESPYTNQSGNGIIVSRSNESLTRLIEQPTCIECLYQRKPS